MGLDLRDISRFGAEAQAQIARKLGEAARQQQASKYHATPDQRDAGDGKTIRFASKAEARRYDTLRLLYKAGAISDLRLQPQYTLREAYTTPEGEHVRAIRYVADFSYVKDGRLIVEDVKSRATKTRVYGIKRKLLRETHGIEISEIE